MSGYVAAATLALVLAAHARQVLESRPARRSAAAGLVALGLAAAVGLYSKRGAGTGCEHLLGSACTISPERYLPNHVSSYLWLDLPGFLSRPWVLVTQGPSDADLFWNQLLKSSLFGTMSGVDPELGYRFDAWLALAANAVLLALLAYTVASFAACSRARRRELRTVLVFGGLSLLSVAVFRAAVPVPHHGDFRHAFAALLVLVCAFAASVACHRAAERRRRAWLGALLAFGLAALSVATFVPKRALLARLAPTAWLEPVRPGSLP